MNFDIKRLLTQFCATILYNGKPFGVPPVKACVPGLNCRFCPGAIGGCPLGMLQSIARTGFERIPFYALASIVLVALLLGRIICGWLCPFGLLQDLLYKVPGYKIAKNQLTAKLVYLKYLILLVAIFLAPPFLYYTKNISYPIFCDELCPNGLLNALVMIATDSGFGFGFALFSYPKLIIFLAIAVGSMVIFRPFCRFLCPLGAFYALFNKISIFAMTVDKSKCIGCNACHRACLMDCKQVGDMECIACGKCKAACPTKAIGLGLRKR